MRLAAGGELGVGVGEEEWGSGEREVLEDFARRTGGLVDLLVARFGEPAREGGAAEPWMGIGRAAGAADGVVFSGVGRVSRGSMRDLAGWLAEVFCWGEAAYAVREAPAAEKKRRRQKAAAEPPPKSASKAASSSGGASSPPPPPGIPRPIVVAADTAPEDATARPDGKPKDPARSKSPPAAAPQEQETWRKVLTLGYGTAWGVSETADAKDAPDESATSARVARHVALENGGHFVVGVRGDPDDESDELLPASADESEAAAGRRVRARTVHVTDHADDRRPSRDMARRQRQPRNASPAPSDSAHQPPATATSDYGPRETRALRLVVYARRPFLLAMLFTTSPTPATLAHPRFYRDLHTFLSALTPLVARRSGPAVGAQRLLLARQQQDQHAGPSGGGGAGKWMAAAMLGPAGVKEREGVWDVVHDARTLCTRTTMPGIPAPGEEIEGWSRAEAVGVHAAAVEVLCGVGSGERERSLKTGRGWWVVWARMDDDEHGEHGDDHDERSDGDERDDGTVTERGDGEGELEVMESGDERTGLKRRVGREILLVRRAADAEQKGKGRVVSGWGSGGGHRLEGAKMGIGFDARRYMEGMMRFGR
jgi:hypothetical protein